MMTASAAKAIAKNFLNVKDERILFLIGKAAEAEPSDFVITSSLPDVIQGSFRLGGELVEFELAGRNIKSYIL